MLIHALTLPLLTFCDGSVEKYEAPGQKCYGDRALDIFCITQSKKSLFGLLLDQLAKEKAINSVISAQFCIP